MQDYTLYWIRPDGQGDFDMGRFETREAAEAAIPAAKQELLDQCAEECQRQQIEDGTWDIQDNSNQQART